jgi:cytochrome P450
MATETDSQVRYDPYDQAIHADPYPVFRRLREEVPLYYNKELDFYALSRFDDVDEGLVDHATFSSAKGGILELIKANVDIPSGVFIFEDPPLHTAHRGILAKVFTPRKMNALEPRVREFCVHLLDDFVGAERFDFVRDFGAIMPMRVILRRLHQLAGGQSLRRSHDGAAAGRVRGPER